LINMGDDVSFASGKKGQEFYLNTLVDRAVILALYDNTVVDANGTVKTLNADEYWHLAGGGVSQHITSTKPVVVHTLGRANTFNDLGTYLGGRSAIRHYYNATGNYNVNLTVFDNAGMSHSRATTAAVDDSNPPVADHGGPYVLNEGNAVNGAWSVTLDASKSTDDFAIYKYEWDFDASNGIQINATGSKVNTTYSAPGVYTVTLRVYDNALQMTQATTTVTVLVNNPPEANAGGPYTFGEEAASYGVWTSSLDGSKSKDDFAIYSYEWIAGKSAYDFAGTVIDGNEWLFSSGVTQNNGLTIVGTGSWGNRYLFSKKDYAREERLTYQARILPQNTSGNQHGMFGFKNNNTDYNYTQMPYAIYFDNGTIRIDENGSNPVSPGSYTRNVQYDIRIVLKDSGVEYYYKQASTTKWTLLYTSSTNSSLLKLGATVHTGTFVISEMSISKSYAGVNPD
ncbi:MAG: PKD domain-containing protein, partial [Geobacter sp.]|nr:PKD domain-containing protein [Geobacter sp.]